MRRKTAKLSRDRSVTKEIAQRYSSLSSNDNAKWHASAWYAKAVPRDKTGRRGRGTLGKKRGDSVLNERDRRTSGPLIIRYRFITILIGAPRQWN